MVMQMQQLMSFLCILLCLKFCEADYDNSYDYIVVGAGSAGSVVANRLSENPKNKVLLLEAGGRPNLMSEIPNFYFYMQSTKYDWNYTTQMPSFPEFGIKRQPLPLPQGKIIGGCSSINAMLYTRGNKYDFDEWAKTGAVGWNWSSVLPVFMKSENNQDKEIVKNGLHGTRGEMFVQWPPFRTPLASKYLKAAEELGYKLGDVNGPTQLVFMNPQLTIHKGRRWSSYKSFIYPIEGRGNLRVLTSAFVRKVLFEGNRTKGVEFDYRGKLMRMWARKEVILSAGAIKSPQILMLSGIGPKNELQKLKIPVIADLPVGKNFHDHSILVASTKSINIQNMSGLSMSEVDYNEFLANGRGILSDISTEALGFLSSKYSNRCEWPDYELVFSTFVQPNSFAFNGTAKPTSSCIVIVTTPESRGEITLLSTDPYIHPHMNPNYLSSNKDVKVMVEAIKKCQDFFNTKTMKKVLSNNEEDSSRAQCQNSSDYLACFAKSSVLPGYHLGGTCKMGSPLDKSSVVDPSLRVIGVEGLRVVDNSVIPLPVSSHTHAVAVMIGEKGAESILE